MTVCLCACSGVMVDDRTAHHRASAPFFFVHNEQPSAGETYLENESDVYRPMEDISPAERSRNRLDMAEGAGFAPSEPAVPKGCSLRSRFDRRSAISYNFSDQSQLALHMDIGGVGFSGVELDKVMMKFHYKFQPIKSRKERCLYPSAFQGVVGSGYNELMVRQKNTVWDELRQQNPLGLFD